MEWEQPKGKGLATPTSGLPPGNVLAESLHMEDHSGRASSALRDSIWVSNVALLNTSHEKQNKEKKKEKT